MTAVRDRVSGVRFQEKAQEKAMKKAFVGLTFSAVLFALCGSVDAQQPKRVARIGILSNSAVGDKERVEGFLRGLRELGWTEGQNITIEYRWYEGNLDRLPKLATDLVQLKVDVIFAPGSIVVEAAKRETTTIPIVFAVHGDPVGTGHVSSLARPGGNITGLAQLQAEQNAKGLELLKEIVPTVNRVAVLWDPKAPAHKRIIKAVEATGQEIGLRLLLFGVENPSEIDKVFAAIAREKAGAVLILQAPIFIAARQQLADLGLKYRLPTMFGFSDFVELGGLMSYGTNAIDLWRRAAVYVDKILKGTKPADLPVELPKKFELIINLKTAKQIGLTVPPNVLARADKVIR
jgi:putative tryptophan/tyrosine transport system substrate-binding protein